MENRNKKKKKKLKKIEIIHTSTPNNGILEYYTRAEK